MTKYNWFRENIKKNSELQKLYKKIIRLYSSDSEFYIYYTKQIYYNKLILKEYHKHFRRLKLNNSYVTNSFSNLTEIPKFVYFLELREKPNFRNSNRVYLHLLNTVIDFNLDCEFIDKIKYQNLYELHKDSIQLEKVFGTLTAQQRIRYFKNFKSNKDRSRKFKRII